MYYMSIAAIYINAPNYIFCRIGSSALYVLQEHSCYLYFVKTVVYIEEKYKSTTNLQIFTALHLDPNEQKTPCYYYYYYSSDKKMTSYSNGICLYLLVWRIKMGPGSTPGTQRLTKARTQNSIEKIKPAHILLFPCEAMQVPTLEVTPGRRCMPGLSNLFRVKVLFSI